MSVERLVTVKTVFVTGGSLVLSLTKELRLMNIEKGDAVKITIEKVK